MKVDFRNIVIKDINGNDLKADVTEILGNLMYMQGQDITECELGQKLWHAKDAAGAFTPVEISEEEEKKLRQQFEKYPYLIRTALLKVLNG